MILLIVLVLALLGLIAYSAKLYNAVKNSPQLHKVASQGDKAKLEHAAQQPEQKSVDLFKVSVIVPVYNEAENIQSCVTSVLHSTQLSEDCLEVWVVDDQSTDNTLAIAQSLQQNLHDPRLKVLAGQPKSPDQVWVGKNWACAQAAEQANGDYFLFIDADVRLQPQAIEMAVRVAEQQQIDLLSCGPAIICSCLTEWLVQPLIISTIQVGFNFEAVNDPKSDVAFAAGPFMFFRRSAYERIGGHRSVADQVVEDVELSRRIKQSGLNLKFFSGTEVVAVQMYRSWGQLWEGWTKNLYLGSQRNLTGMLYFVAVILLICTTPWLGLISLLAKWLWLGLDVLDWCSVGIALIAIALQYIIRRVGAEVSRISPRYWWLTGLGGILVASIAIASIIKTETGWGWTWRGRSLSLPSPP